MSIFVIFRTQNPEKIAEALNEQLPDDHLLLQHGEFLVSTSGTAKELSDRLKISDGTNGAAMVFSMANYFGRAPTDIWDWVKTKAEKPVG